LARPAGPPRGTGRAGRDGGPSPPGPHTEPTRPAYGSHPGRARAGRVTGCRRGSTGGVRRLCRAGVLAAGARWGLVLAGPVVAGADGPVAAGAKGPVAAGAKGPVAAGAKGPVAAGAKGPVMAGAQGPVAAGADGPVAAGADGPVAPGARGPVAAGARGPVMAGVGGPVMAGVGGLPAPGPVGRIVTDGPSGNCPRPRSVAGPRRARPAGRPGPSPGPHRAAAASPSPPPEVPARASARARRSPCRCSPVRPTPRPCPAGPKTPACRRRRAGRAPPRPRPRGAGCPPPPGPAGQAPSPRRTTCPGRPPCPPPQRTRHPVRPALSEDRCSGWSPSHASTTRNDCLDERVGSRGAPGPQGSTRRAVNGNGGSWPQRMAVHGGSRMRYPVCSQTLRADSVTTGTFLPAGNRAAHRQFAPSPAWFDGSQRGPGHGVVNGALVQPRPAGT